MSERIITIAARALLVAPIVALFVVCTARAQEPVQLDHWELALRATVDGKPFRAQRLNDHDYKNPGSCVQDGLMLGPPPAAQVVNGHNVIFDIACVHVTAEKL